MRIKYGKRVKFIDIPITFRGQDDSPLRLYYVAESIGKGHMVKDEIFKTRFDHGVNPFDPGVVNYLARTLGIGEAYQKEGKKEWVTKKIEEAKKRSARYGINSTPTIVIHKAAKMSPGKSMEGFVKNLPNTIDDMLKPRK